MASGTIVGSPYIKDGRAYLHVAVDEGGSAGRVEHVGSVEVDAAFQAMTNAEKKAALIAAVKAARDAQVGGPTTISAISGTVTI